MHLDYLSNNKAVFLIYKVDDNSNLDEEKFKAYVKEMAVHDYQKSIADETATTCISEVKKRLEEKPDKKEGGCSKIGMMVGFCTLLKFVKACPEEFKDQSEGCQKIREFQPKKQQPQ